MSQSDEIQITANYGGTCRECGKEIFVGDVIFWSRQLGVRHTNCHQDDTNPENALTVEETGEFLEYAEALKSLKCGKCGADLPKNGDKFVRASSLGKGFQRVCVKDFK